MSAATDQQEVVFRDPPRRLGRIGSRLVGMLVVLSWAAIGSAFGVSPRTSLSSLIVLVAGLAAAALPLRPEASVSVSSHGVSLHEWWFRDEHYSWEDIESFDFGNPADPGPAYLVLAREPGAPARHIVDPAVHSQPRWQVTRSRRCRRAGCSSRCRRASASRWGCRPRPSRTRSR